MITLVIIINDKSDNDNIKICCMELQKWWIPTASRTKHDLCSLCLPLVFLGCLWSGSGLCRRGRLLCLGSLAEALAAALTHVGVVLLPWTPVTAVPDQRRRLELVDVTGHLVVQVGHHLPNTTWPAFISSHTRIEGDYKRPVGLHVVTLVHQSFNTSPTKL